VNVTTDTLAHSWEFVNGPTERETDGEAIARLVRLEAASVPAGVTAGAWMRELLEVAERKSFQIGAYWSENLLHDLRERVAKRRDEMAAAERAKR
jgi:hypothetical protein